MVVEAAAPELPGPFTKPGNVYVKEKERDSGREREAAEQYIPKEITRLKPQKKN